MLSVQDLDDDDDWRFATVIVPNNRERIDTIGDAVIDFSISTGQPVVRWMCTIREWHGAPENEDLREAAMRDPCFWQYLVQHANATCNGNLSVDINITNGAPIKLYSLTFTTQQEQIDYETMRLNTQPGEFITVKQTPMSVNVVPWPDDTDNHAKTYNPYSIETTLGTNLCVIPITAQHYTANPKPMPVRDGEGWYASRAVIVPQIPFDLAFSMTSF
jgi:hypothetical protein